jgi:hypothetical protein
MDWISFLLGVLVSFLFIWIVETIKKKRENKRIKAYNEMARRRGTGGGIIVSHIDDIFDN